MYSVPLHRSAHVIPTKREWDSNTQQASRAKSRMRVEYSKRNTEYTSNFVADLVSLVQNGESSENTFYWRSNDKCMGMLDSLRGCLSHKYGKKNTEEHMRVIQSIEEKGGPRQWALLWLLCLPFDAGLQNFVSGVDEQGVRQRNSAVDSYVGTDGVKKCASDYFALQNYLRAVRASTRTYTWNGLRAVDRAKLFQTLARWHIYGGRALAPL